MTDRPRLLFVAPLMPRPDGGGLAMRAAAVLDGLSRRFAVELFVVPVAGPDVAPSAHVLARTARLRVLDLDAHLDPHFALLQRVIDPVQRDVALATYPRPFAARFGTALAAASLFEWYDARPAALHVMRLYMAPFAEPFLRGPREARLFAVLDLDDDEPRTRQRLAALHRARGEAAEAEREAAEGARYAALAERSIQGFDCVTAAAPSDLPGLVARHPGIRFAALPNTLAPATARRPRHARGDAPFRLLFVGTLGYLPNRDAVELLCGSLCDALRRALPGPFEIHVAGAGGEVLFASCAAPPELRVHGFVADLAPLYAMADIAVAPLRAGGGTRIKILGAFAHGVPVVATRLGAEGLAVTDGTHLLIGDNTDALARACGRIAATPRLAAVLAANAARLLATAHGPDALTRALDAIYGPGGH